MKHIHIFIAALLLAPLAVLAANGLKTGEIGFPYLLRALANSGRSDVIFAMINQTDKQNRMIGDKQPADADARTVGNPRPGSSAGIRSRLADTPTPRMIRSNRTLRYFLPACSDQCVC